MSLGGNITSLEICPAIIICLIIDAVRTILTVRTRIVIPNGIHRAIILNVYRGGAAKKGCIVRSGFCFSRCSQSVQVCFKQCLCSLGGTKYDKHCITGTHGPAHVLTRCVCKSPSNLLAGSGDNILIECTEILGVELCHFFAGCRSGYAKAGTTICSRWKAVFNISCKHTIGAGSCRLPIQLRPTVWEECIIIGLEYFGGFKVRIDDLTLIVDRVAGRKHLAVRHSHLQVIGGGNENSVLFTSFYKAAMVAGNIYASIIVTIGGGVDQIAVASGPLKRGTCKTVFNLVSFIIC